MKSTYQISKEAVLVIAGAFLGILAVPFEKQIFNNLFLFFIVLAVLILYGIGLKEWLIALFFWMYKYFNKKISKIGIYAPFENIVGENSTWVSDEVEVKNISDLLTGKDVHNKIDKKENVFKKFPIVLNPFGGVYPEKDLSCLISLDIIFDFVSNGGIYINIDFILFYYAFDKILIISIETTPLAGCFSGLRSFSETILTNKLHSFVFGLPQGTNGLKEEKRVIEFSTPENNLFESMVERENRKFSPVVKIPYGKGFFIFSTLQIDKGNIEENIMRVINSATKR